MSGGDKLAVSGFRRARSSAAFRCCGGKPTSQPASRCARAKLYVCVLVLICYCNPRIDCFYLNIFRITHTVNGIVLIWSRKHRERGTGPSKRIATRVGRCIQENVMLLLRRLHEIVRCNGNTAHNAIHGSIDICAGASRECVLSDAQNKTKNHHVRDSVISFRNQSIKMETVVVVHSTQVRRNHLRVVGIVHRHQNATTYCSILCQHTD